jgi:U3 small nucleolar RNA-associated protein 10
MKAVHALFQEIGEEYLLFLPECMPFFSEMMEDDSSDVVDATVQAMQFIEELSGEKLDSYL